MTPPGLFVSQLQGKDQKPTPPPGLLPYFPGPGKLIRILYPTGNYGNVGPWFHSLVRDGKGRVSSLCHGGLSPLGDTPVFSRPFRRAWGSRADLSLARGFSICAGFPTYGVGNPAKKLVAADCAGFPPYGVGNPAKKSRWLRTVLVFLRMAWESEQKSRWLRIVTTSPRMARKIQPGSPSRRPSCDWPLRWA